MFIVDSLGLNLGPPDLEFTGCHHDNQPGLLWGLCSQRSRDGRDRAEQNKRVVFRRQKTAALPELRRLRIDGIDHQRASAHELSSLDAALERMLEQPRTDAPTCPNRVSGQLAEKETGNGIWWLTCPNRTRQYRRNDGRRCNTVVADDTAIIVDDHDGGKALLLVGKRPSL